MTSFLHRLVWLLLPALLALAPSPAAAQIYWGYNPDLYGLHGAAAVIRAQGQYAESVARAAMTREKTRQERITTERQKGELLLWQLDNLPTTEDYRQRAIKEGVKRAANTPPLNEIWSGESINRLMLELQKVPSDVLTSDTYPLDPEYLAKLNVNTGFDTANVGMIREFQKGKPLPWPRALQRDVFTPGRERTEAELKSLIQAVTTGKAAGQHMSNLEKQIGEMKKDIIQLNRDKVIDVQQAVQSNSFFSQLLAALTALDKPDGADFLTKYAARGKTAGELVHNMISNGLRFTVVTPGNESAYTAVYSAVAQLYRRVGGSGGK